MPADLDIGQVAFIVIAMIAAFVQWVWKGIQESKERKKYEQELNPEPRSLRDISREREVPAPTRTTPPPRSAPGTPPANLWDVFEQIKQELNKAQEQAAPSPPPPLSGQVRRAVPPPMTRAIPTPPPPTPVSTPAPVIEKAVEAVAKVVPSASARDDFSSLRGLLMDQKSLRNAVLLREILGPPKALQTSGELML